MSEAPRLRGHHLVCLHFFRGAGYSEEFVDNLGGVVRAARDHGIEVIAGPDDVCEKCPSLKNARCAQSEDADEGISKMDKMALRLLDVSPGKRIGWPETREKILEIFPSWHHAWCISCSWKKACEGEGLYRRLQEGLSARQR